MTAPAPLPPPLSARQLVRRSFPSPSVRFCHYFPLINLKAIFLPASAAPGTGRCDLLPSSPSCSRTSHFPRANPVAGPSRRPHIAQSPSFRRLRSPLQRRIPVRSGARRCVDGCGLQTYRRSLGWISCVPETFCFSLTHGGWMNRKCGEREARSSIALPHVMSEMLLSRCEAFGVDWAENVDYLPPVECTGLYLEWNMREKVS